MSDKEFVDHVTKYRNEGSNEWKDDQLAEQQAEIMELTAQLEQSQSKVSALTVDNHLLLASNARMRSALRAHCAFFADEGYTEEWEQITRVLDETPAQSLAHIEARGLWKLVEPYGNPTAMSRAVSFQLYEVIEFAKQLEQEARK